MSSALVNSLMLQSLNNSDVERVQSLLNDSSDAGNVLDCFSNTALHLAAERGDANIVRVLVQRGADVRATNIHGETAFITAVKHGHLEICKVLVDGGFVIDSEEVQNIYGLTPLMYAVRDNRVEIVEYILKHSNSVNVTNKAGHTALFEACRIGNQQCVELLLRAGSATCTADRHGQTPLLLSIRNGHLECVRALLQNGADPCQTGSTILTGRWRKMAPLKVALLMSRLDMASMLWDAMASSVTELRQMPEDPVIKEALNTPNLKEWFLQHSSSPRSLVESCLREISCTIGFSPERKGRVKVLCLPGPFENKLLFRDV